MPPKKAISLFSRIIWRVLSVPIFLKILGIGAVVAIVFGSATLNLTQNGMADRLYLLLEGESSTVARTLAEQLEQSLVTGDLYAVQRQIDQFNAVSGHIRYIIVRRPDQSVIAHTFDNGVPSSLQAISTNLPRDKVNTQLLEAGEGLIFDILAPVLNGSLGSVQIGISDLVIRDELQALIRLILGALALSVAIGISLAIFLTYLLTNPVHQLEKVAQDIQSGNFEARAQVFSDDEIGSLATTINHMAESLEVYRAEVQEKEAAREALMGKIVSAQEDERKNVARELHDQLGQSLSKTLLTFQTIRCECGCGDGRCAELEGEICGHIDEVRRLAWDMRPSVLDDYGLDSALERYFAEIEKRFDIEIDYECLLSPSNSRLPAQVEVTLYRIAQEAMTNVLRHASASHVSAVLLQHDSTITLTISDDGCGFSAASPSGRSICSLGLMGMKERATLIGGEVEIESEPGKGTEVLVTIPHVETQK